KFKGTKLYNMLVTNLPAEPKANIDLVKQACNIDLMTAVDSILIGVVGNLDKSARSVMVIKGDFTRDKVAKCAPTVAEKKGKKLVVTEEGDITTYAVEGDKPVSVGWVGDLMVLTPQSSDGDKTFLSDVMKKTSSVKSNKPLSDLLNKADSSGTIYGAGLP